MSFISISLIVEEAFHAVVRGFRNYFLVIIGARFQPKNVVILQLCSAQDLLDQPSISQGTGGLYLQVLREPLAFIGQCS